LKQGDALSPLPLKFALEYACKRVLGKPGWLLDNASDVHILGGSVHTRKKKQTL